MKTEARAGSDPTRVAFRSKGCFLYLLLDPETGSPCWVGQSCSILSRVYGQTNPALRGWRQELWTRRLRPKVKICAFFSSREEAKRIEDFLIIRLRLRGEKLFNRYPSATKTQALIDIYGLAELEARTEDVLQGVECSSSNSEVQCV